MVPTQTPWYATKKAINGYIIAGVIIVLFFIIVGTLGSVNNHYVALNQNVQTSNSNISKESQRRVDLFNNLVDAVQSYNGYEAGVLEKVTAARTQGNKGDVTGAALAINAVVEAYPVLKSQANYQQAMLEFSVTENRLAQYREQYNNDVRSFDSYVQSFPAGIFLSIEGKDKTQKPYLNYNVDNSQARNLFSKQ